MYLPKPTAEKALFERRHLEFICPILEVGFQDDSKVRDLVLNNALSPFSFLLAHELRSSKPDTSVVQRCLEELGCEREQLELVSCELLITPVETRGEGLELIKCSERQRLQFLANHAELKHRMSSEWAELVAPIKTVTVVTIPGKEDALAHFSGSDTERWGAIHMGPNLSTANVLECMTHEASHHWMNLFEIGAEGEFVVNGWDDHSFVSPWRHDKRPLMGLYHGVYVFTNVLVALLEWCKLENASADQRIHLIAGQVKRGIELLERAQNRFSSEAVELYLATKECYAEVSEELNHQEVNRFHAGIVAAEEMKRK